MTLVKEVQPLNALEPMEVKELPKTTVSRLTHPLKAELLIFVTLFGIVIQVSEMQELNAFESIMVTFSPMTTSFNNCKPLKVYAVKVVKPLPITTFCNFWQPSIIE